MQPRELSNAQIIPAAQPVDAFIRPIQVQARAGLPQLRLPGAPQQSIIRQGSGGNVQGFNQWEQLANALAPFNEALTKTLATGAQLYASSEYEKGRNEAVRASVLANQQREQAGANYAAENRRLEGIDPIAAQMMDKVNPFREAGRINQLSRIAGQEAGTAIVSAYRNNPEAATWAPDDPGLTRIRVEATQGLLKKYGLSETTAGFQDYVVPEIGQAWDKVTNEQWTDRQNFLKDTVAPMTATEVWLTYSKAYTDGKIEWTESDPSGATYQRTALKGTPEFDRGLKIRVTQVLDTIGRTVGLRGQTTEQTRKTLLQLLETAGGFSALGTLSDEQQKGMDSLINLLGDVEVGPRDAEGRRTTASLFFAPDFLAAKKKRDEDNYEAQRRNEDTALKAFNDELLGITMSMPEGDPARKAAIQGLIEKYGKVGLGLGDMTKAVDDAGRISGNIAMRENDTTGPEDFFVAIQGLDPAAWNGPQLKQQLDQVLRGLPQDEQRKYLARFASLNDQKGKEGQNQKGPVINPIVDRVVTAAIRQQYPTSVSQAALRGVTDVKGFMAWGDANVKTAASRLSDGLRTHIQNRLAEAAQRKGQRLSAAEETAVASRAAQEYLATDDENLRKYLFPGGKDGGEGVQGGKVEQQGAAGPKQPPPGRKFTETAPVSSSNLDNVDPAALQRGDVVMQKGSIQQEVIRVIQGKPPSAAIQRAAKVAGMSPAEFLLKQAEGYRGMLSPTTIQELKKKTRGGTAAGNKVSSNLKPGPNPYMVAGSWIGDILLGVKPAMASNGGGRDGNIPFTDGAAGAA
jgi:hypothetical protein